MIDRIYFGDENPNPTGIMVSHKGSFAALE